MKLAVGKVILVPSFDVAIADHVMYSAKRDTDITFIQLNNESKTSVIVNLFIEFIEERVRILPLDKVIDPNGMILFENLKYSLMADEKLLVTADKDFVVTYIVNGDYT